MSLDGDEASICSLTSKRRNVDPWLEGASVVLPDSSVTLNTYPALKRWAAIERPSDWISVGPTRSLRHYQDKDEAAGGNRTHRRDRDFTSAEAGA